jgi:ComF family protein
MTITALRYVFPVDQLVLALKFAGRLPPGRLLGELLAESVAVACTKHPDVLVPVPLHPARLRERGFNQAMEIARPVSHALGVPVSTRACRRIRATAPQSDLKGKARRRNVRGAFIADEHVAGLHVAVIDDVYTTGSTIAAVTAALRSAGAARVDAWCVARAGIG